MTMLERAARALAKAQSGADEWDAYDEAFQQQLLENARVVLEAIREPSVEMTDALRDELLREYGDVASRTKTTAMWQAMIDAALAE